MKFITDEGDDQNSWWLVSVEVPSINWAVVSAQLYQDMQA